MCVANLNRAVILCVFLLLQGCGGDNGKAPDAPVLPRLASPPVAAPSVAPGDGSVAILPEQPLVETPLFAAFRGAGATSYSWQKNGETIADAVGDRLEVGSFAKGDRISVVVKNDGRDYRAEVTIGNSPPLIKKVTFRDNAIRAGRPIELNVEAVDPDGDPVTLVYKWMLNEEANVVGNEVTLPAGAFARGDRVGYEVTPSDGELEGVPYQGSAVEVPNAPPVITSQPPLEFKSTIYRYDVKATDPDGDPLSYTLESPPAGMTIDTATGSLNWSLVGVQAGEYQMNIVVEDSAGAKAFQEFRLNISPPQ